MNDGKMRSWYNRKFVKRDKRPVVRVCVPLLKNQPISLPLNLAGRLYHWTTYVTN
jgi:hypothetical protein